VSIAAALSQLAIGGRAGHHAADYNPAVPRSPAIELTLVVALGTANVLSERAGGKAVVVGAGLAAWVVYAALALRRDPAVAHQWGLGGRHFRPALAAAAALGAPAAMAITAVALAIGTFPPPRSFWLVLAVYPLWGVAQQFLLNAALASNLARFLPPALVPPVAASLFALAHAPDLPVMALTLPAGLVWTLVYRRWPNLWALGVVHGALGTLAFYGLLGRDPLSP
jgi:uncharacterized protein